jgi:adenine deaminase
METVPGLLAVARGDQPADVLLVGGRVANVFTGELEAADIALSGGFIAGVGEGYSALEVVDVEGRVIAPGLIDAHVHIESSLVTPEEFARAVVPRGTTTVVTDPHEIANVHGLDGIRYMLDASEGLDLSVFVQASSCVPATHMATSGATLDADALIQLLSHPRVLGLAEVMNFPGAFMGDPEVWAKLEAFRGRPVDGHAPGLRGRLLNAYIVSGPGSDHECTTAEEALEKLRRGLTVFLREATNARNLGALMPILTTATLHRCALCTDDRQPPDLMDEGGIDFMVREIIRSGVAPLDALRLATLNPAEYFGLADRGAVAPGRRADLLVLRDLERLEIEEVWTSGRPVFRDGTLRPSRSSRPPAPLPPSIHVELDPRAFEIPAHGSRIRVIGAVPDQLVTTAEVADAPISGDRVHADPERDLLKIAVVERHRGSGRVGLGMVRGMGLKSGAMAGSVAHDHHNIIAVGVDDESLHGAVAEVVRMGGGLAVAQGGRVLARLALPVGGLMSDRPMEEVRQGLEEVISAARALGSEMHDPFMALSFLGLEVIPSLKITDLGLVDVDGFRHVDLWVES